MNRLALDTRTARGTMGSKSWRICKVGAGKGFALGSMRQPAPASSERLREHLLASLQISALAGVAGSPLGKDAELLARGSKAGICPRAEMVMACADSENV